jgi:heat shock protein HtpX
MQRVDFRDQISKNKRSSFFLLFFIFLFLILLGYVIGNAVGGEYFFIILIFSIIFSLSYILIGFYNSDKIAILSVRGVLADRKKYKDFYNLVEGLTIASGLPMPKLYIMKSKQINAFASGRNPENSVICVTLGALEKLERRELEAVLSHELSHIANYDIRYMTLVTVLVGMVSIISEIFLRSLWMGSDSNNDSKSGVIFMIIGIVLAILAPIVVYLVQLSISRKREYSADATAVKFTRYPDGLIKALKKIQSDSLGEEHISKAIAPLFFSNPLKDITSTHPPIEERIKVLEKM